MWHYFFFFNKKKKKNLIFLSAEVEHFSLRIILSILYFILTDFNIKLFEIRYFNRRSKKKLRGQIFLEHQFILSSIIYKIYFFFIYLFFFLFYPKPLRLRSLPLHFQKGKEERSSTANSSCRSNTKSQLHAQERTLHLLLVV